MLAERGNDAYALCHRVGPCPSDGLAGGGLVVRDVAERTVGIDVREQFVRLVPNGLGRVRAGDPPGADFEDGQLHHDACELGVASFQVVRIR